MAFILNLSCIFLTVIGSMLSFILLDWKLWVKVLLSLSGTSTTIWLGPWTCMKQLLELFC